MFEWTEGYDELRKICTLFNLYELNNPIKVCYKSTKSFIQQGPQCGLVALAMASDCSDEKFIETIFCTAKCQDYTFNGEIFSIFYMESLAKTYLNCNVEVFSGQLNCEEIMNHLLDNGQMLVPYDTDKNNAPGLYNGHKAHWALVCGAVQTENDFYVIARHGKSKNIGIWTLRDLSLSNSQLNEFSPDRKLDKLEYKIPKGGLNGTTGLKRYALLLK
ncbi:hypothetical protein WA026_018706 [Henosepilachna vigintioctopunctata]|uniref:Actin maturation protease n=1 Tax=Henosepilachna vigintioctopunctata TaxID=420089 RepID=A0AAW1TQF6_9CUCU